MTHFHGNLTWSFMCQWQSEVRVWHPSLIQTRDWSILLRVSMKHQITLLRINWYYHTVGKPLHTVILWESLYTLSFCGKAFTHYHSVGKPLHRTDVKSHIIIHVSAAVNSQMESWTVRILIRRSYSMDSPTGNMLAWPLKIMTIPSAIVIQWGVEIVVSVQYVCIVRCSNVTIIRNISSNILTKLTEFINWNCTQDAIKMHLQPFWT